MGRKSQPEQYPIFLSLESFDSLVTDAPNLVRWNPVLAIKFMEMALVKAISPIQTSAWNKAALRINETIASIESQFFYNEKEYWKEEKPSKLTIVKEDLTLEDYISMKQFSK